jgi:6,7-dimethyl-8-ribityllumazine synthase
MKSIGIVIGEFHRQLAESMLADARKAAAGRVEIKEIIWVPGTYEAPLMVRKLLKREDIDCVAVLGFIEKGETLHGKEMGATTSLLFKQLELEFGKPVGMGIIGPGATAEQARKRIHYAGRAVRAALRMCDQL